MEIGPLSFEHTGIFAVSAKTVADSLQLTIPLELCCGDELMIPFSVVVGSTSTATITKMLM